MCWICIMLLQPPYFMPCHHYDGISIHHIIFHLLNYFITRITIICGTAKSFKKLETAKESKMTTNSNMAEAGVNPSAIAGNEYVCDMNIFIRVSWIFSRMTTLHQSVMFSRLAITFPESPAYPPSNDIFVGFMNSFIKNLDISGYDPMYGWIYSKRSYDAPQTYFICLWLDGQNLPSMAPVMQKAEYLWSRALDMPQSSVLGLIAPWAVPSDGIILRRSDPSFNSACSRCLDLAIQLAEFKNKGYAPQNVREFGSSQRVRPDLGID